MTWSRISGADLTAGLSLANLFLLRAWFVAGGTAYFAAGLPVGRSHSGLILDWFLLAGLLAGLSAWSRRGPWALRASAVLIGALMLVPLDWLLRHGTGLMLPEVPKMMGVAPWLFWGAALVLVASARWIQFTILRIIPLVALPIVLVTVTFAFTPLFASAPATPIAREKPPRTDGGRVLWLVFDELEQRMLAGDRPDSPPLPAFSRLMSEAFVASSATAPARKTVMAVPSMFTGRAVTLASPSGRDLVLRFADGGAGRWSEQGSAFREVRANGFATAVAGWFHPYCSALADQWDSCAWMPMEPPENAVLAGMLRHAQEAVGGMSFLLRNGFENVLLTRAQRERNRAQHAEALRVIAREGERLARRLEAGLGLIHYPVPHPPGVGDLIDPPGRASWNGSEYYGNAILADRALSSLRHVLESTSAWERTVIVVTSDHAWRTVTPRDDRVPLIVRFPDGRRLAYAPEVSLLVLRDLLPRLVSREIVTADQLATYLSARP